MDRNENILQLMNDYLMTRFGDQTTPACFGLTNGVIDAKTDTFDLYIRMIDKTGGTWGANTLVVARIGFEEKRAGHGTNFLIFLTKMVLEHNFSHIGIESTNEESSSFAKKLGFQSIDGSNYVASAEDLVSYFSREGEV